MVRGYTQMAKIDTFELELRKLAGVAAVGFSGRGEDRTVHLTVPVAADRAAMREAAEELARLYLERPVSVVIESLSDVADPAERSEGVATAEATLRVVASVEDMPSVELTPSSERTERAERIQPLLAPPRPAPAAVPRPASAVPRPAPAAPVAPSPAPARVGRVELLGVFLASGGTEVEVHLGRHGLRTIGRGEAGKTASSAVATLDALDRLGWAMPFTVRAAVRLAMGIDGAVAVTLNGPGGGRMGISHGVTAEEATAKATLQALNRYLNDPRHAPG